MKKRIFSLLLTLIMTLTVLCGFSGCKGEKIKMKQYDMEKYVRTAGYTFLYDTDFDDGFVNITGKISIGATFTVAPDCYLTTISPMMECYSNPEAAFTLKIFKWDESYEKTVKSKPVYSSRRKNMGAGTYQTFFIEEGLIGEGTYLYLICDGSEALVSAYKAWEPSKGKTVTSEADESDGISLVEGYFNGKKASTSVPKVYVAYSKYVEQGPDYNKNYTKLTPGKAHVIILSGQSNAAGQSLNELLTKNLGESKCKKYKDGFENILIDYAVESGRKSEGLVPVQFGQGSAEERFGPEIGMAEYLSEKYPGEKFYIIKSAWSGAGLTKHFNPNAAEYKFVEQWIGDALSRMVKDGLDPEIFAFCWMQGETDSWYMDDTLCYDEKEIDLINRISARFSDYIAPNGLAFMDAAISDSYAWTFRGIINAQKQIVCGSSVNYYYVDTLVPENLGCLGENNDIAHYDSVDMLKVGRLFGEAVAKAYEAGK